MKRVLTGILRSINRNTAVPNRVPPFRKKSHRPRINDQITLKKHQVNSSHNDLEKAANSSGLFLCTYIGKTKILILHKMG